MIIDGVLAFSITCKEPNGKQYINQVLESVLYDDDHNFIDTMTREGLYYAKKAIERVPGRELISVNIDEYQYCKDDKYIETKVNIKLSHKLGTI